MEAEARPVRSTSPAVVGLAGLVGASILVLTVGRTVQAPPSLLVLVLMVAPIWSLLVGLVGAGLLLRAPTDGRIWGLLVVQLGLWMGIWGRAWWASPDLVDGETVRVMAWNVQRLGFEDDDQGERLQCVAQAVEAAQPDLISLMEVSGRDVERLSAALELRCQYVDYRGTGSDKRGGLAACARGSDWRLGRSGPRRFVQDSDWHFVFSEMVREDEHQVVNLISVHLQPNTLALTGPASPGAVAETHQEAAAALLERMAALQDPTIVAGDFNSTRETPLHGAMRKHLVDVFERAEWGPGGTVLAADLLPLRVDFVYATPDLPAAGAWIPTVDCSDHRPVVADIGLPEPWDRSGG
jgi:endonuclease/exonuclease/phosphatase family metal-dependent hydrolase